MKETIIQAMGQICNVQVVHEVSKIKAFNLQKERGLVMTLVKKVFEDGRLIPAAGDTFEANGAIECIVKDDTDVVCNGALVIFTCSESEAEKLRKGELGVQGTVTVF